MKSIILLLLILPTAAFSAGILTSKPNVLELRKYRTASGVLELRYIHDSPRIVMRIGAGSKETDEFFKKVMDSDISRLNCDGDFFPAIDMTGAPYVNVNSLKSCIDEDNDVVAHSIGMLALKPEQVEASKKFIADSLKPVTAVVADNVNDSNLPKEKANPSAGVFSSKLSGKTITK